jgi:FeS assembly SUF system protein
MSTGDSLDRIGVVVESADGGATRKAASATEGGAMTDVSPDASLEERVIATLKTIYDPEIPVNIYELGLIYELEVDEAEGRVHVDMTLTAPGCPVAQTFPGQIEARLRELDGVEEVSVRLVWDPPWTQDRMTEAARLQLGLL